MHLLDFHNMNLIKCKHGTIITKVYTGRSRTFGLKERISWVGLTQHFNCLERTNEPQKVRAQRCMDFACNPFPFPWKRFPFRSLCCGCSDSHKNFSCRCLTPHVRPGFCPSWCSLRNLLVAATPLLQGNHEIPSSVCVLVYICRYFIIFVPAEMMIRRGRTGKAESQLVVGTVKCVG